MTAADDLREEISRMDLERLREAGQTLQRLAGGHFGKEGIPRAVEQEAEVAFRVAQTLARALYGTGELEAELEADGGPEAGPNEGVAPDGGSGAGGQDGKEGSAPGAGPEPGDADDALTGGASPAP